MSLLDDASIVIVPSGYKAGTVYSVKPTDGSGDLSFTRSLDTATRVGSDGLIEKVRTNLVLNSATFVTQTITVDANPHTLSFTGTGTIVITGVGSGTLVGTGVNDRVSLAITTTAGGLILTLTGTATLAQLETGDIATPYIATAGAAVSVGMLANVPRLDYLGGGCPKLLLEPQRTNLITFSEQIDNAAYTNTENTTISANVGTSPDGFQGADKLIPQAISNFHRIARSFTGIGLTPHAFSIFVKRDGYDFFLIRVSDTANNTIGFDLVNGIVTFVASGFTAFIESYGNDWYRVGFVRTFTSSTPTINIRPNPTIVTTNAAPAAFTGDGTSGALVWGCQLEVGSFATSYIPTLGATVTRSADAASKTGISALIGQTEGTLFLEFVPQSIDAVDDFRMQVFTSTNWIFIGNVNGQIRGFIRASGVAQYDDIDENVVIGKRYKLALSYSSAGASFFVNGVKVNELISSITIPATSNFSLGNSNVSADNLLISQVSQSILFPTRLTNAQLQELTTL